MHMIPREKLMIDPGSVFDKPGDVVGNTALSHGEKIEILQQWKQEVTLRLVAEDENMAGEPQDTDRLQQVAEALVVLEDD